MQLNETCVPERITSLIKQHIPDSKLSAESEGKLSYILPLERTNKFPGNSWSMSCKMKPMVTVNNMEHQVDMYVVQAFLVTRHSEIKSWIQWLSHFPHRKQVDRVNYSAKVTVVKVSSASNPGFWGGRTCWILWSLFQTFPPFPDSSQWWCQVQVHSSSVFFILARMSLIVAFILKTELYVSYQTVESKTQLATGKKNKRTKTISNNKKWEFIKTFK